MHPRPVPEDFVVAVLLVQDVNSAISSHLSLANDITKNCTNGLPCLITFLLSSPRLVCRALFGQAAPGTRRLLSLLSGFDAGIGINLRYLWQSCIALRHSLQGLVGKGPFWESGPGLGTCPRACLWRVRSSGPPSSEEYCLPELSPVPLCHPPSFVGSEPLLFPGRPCLPGQADLTGGLPSCVRWGLRLSGSKGQQASHRISLLSGWIQKMKGVSNLENRKYPCFKVFSQSRSYLGFRKTEPAGSGRL